MRVAFFPYNRENPYLDLLELGLKRFGVQVRPTEVKVPYIWWLAQNKGQINVLHFHWLDYIYREVNYRRALVSVVKFGAELMYAKLIGYKVVWTMHNLYPHERLYPQLDWIVRKLVLHLADAVIVHCNAAKDMLEKNFGSDYPIYIAPHGNYIGVYADTISKKEARQQLGIPEQCTVFLHFGQIRAYKGLRQLINSFSSLTSPNIRLVIAGRIKKDYALEPETVLVTKEDKRIIMRIERIPDEEVQIYFRAADIFVSSFENIMTSGSIMLALSFGLPVIAPTAGCLPELITSDIGILYDPYKENGLLDALTQANLIDLDNMGQNALKIADQYCWDNTAKLIYKAYTR